MSEMTPIQRKLLDLLTADDDDTVTQDQAAARLGVSYATMRNQLYLVRKARGFKSTKLLLEWWRWHKKHKMDGAQ